MNATATVRADFAASLYGNLAAAQPNADLFLSPFSVEVALAMCAAGARGETRRALANLIGVPESVAEQNRVYAERIKTVNSAGHPHIQLTTANALWVQQEFQLLPAFQKTVADFYDAVCNTVDFRKADEAAKTINAWIESKTAGKIKELIQRNVIESDTRLILTNAIHFKGKWDREFNKSDTWDEDWHGPSGLRKTPLMQQRGGYLYCENDDFQAIDLPYRGRQLSMLIVLPRQADGLTALETNWAAADTYRKATTALAHEPSVILSLPRFKLESEFTLKPVLSALGADIAFSNDADFSGIAVEPLKIAEVIHKAFVEVNEEGTEAAAATGVVMAKGAGGPRQPKCFIADHPFLFVIRDRATNAVLFCGRVLEPRS